MTAPSTAGSTQPPWKVRWTLYALAILTVLTAPTVAASIGERFLHNLGVIFHMGDDDPIVISPTNPPVVNP